MRQAAKSDIKLEDYMKVIEDHARVGHMHLRHPTIHSVKDLVNDGILVFYKVLNNCYSESGKAAFKSLFIRSLRNYHVTMMKKSFKHAIVSDIGNLNGRPTDQRLARYAERIQQSMSETGMESKLESTENYSAIIAKLTDHEKTYVNSVMNNGRPATRRIMHISLFVESRIRKQIQSKCRELVGER